MVVCTSLRCSSTLALLALPLLACGGEVIGGAGGGGASGTSCEVFRFPELPGSTNVTVRLSNHSGVPLFLGAQGSCGGAPFVIEDAGGSDLVWVRDPCDALCETLQSASCACAADCAVPPVVLIGPGGAYEMSWSGTIFAKVEMPAACFADPSCVGACLREETAPSGILAFSASLWTSAQGCVAEPCTCDAGIEGHCELEGPATVSGEARMAAKKLMFPGAKLIDLVFK